MYYYYCVSPFIGNNYFPFQWKYVENVLWCREIFEITIFIPLPLRIQTTDSLYTDDDRKRRRKRLSQRMVEVWSEVKLRNTAKSWKGREFLCYQEDLKRIMFRLDWIKRRRLYSYPDKTTNSCYMRCRVNGIKCLICEGVNITITITGRM